MPPLFPQYRVWTLCSIANVLVALIASAAGMSHAGDELYGFVAGLIVLKLAQAQLLPWIMAAVTTNGAQLRGWRGMFQYRRAAAHEQRAPPHGRTKRQYT